MGKDDDHTDDTPPVAAGRTDDPSDPDAETETESDDGEGDGETATGEAPAPGGEWKEVREWLEGKISGLEAQLTALTPPAAAKRKADPKTPRTVRVEAPPEPEPEAPPEPRPLNAGISGRRRTRTRRLTWTR